MAVFPQKSGLFRSGWRVTSVVTRRCFFSCFSSISTRSSQKNTTLLRITHARLFCAHPSCDDVSSSMKEKIHQCEDTESLNALVSDWIRNGHNHNPGNSSLIPSEQTIKDIWLSVFKKLLEFNQYDRSDKLFNKLLDTDPSMISKELLILQLRKDFRSKLKHDRSLTHSNPKQIQKKQNDDRNSNERRIRLEVLRRMQSSMDLFLRVSDMNEEETSLLSFDIDLEIYLGLLKNCLYGCGCHCDSELFALARSIWEECEDLRMDCIQSEMKEDPSHRQQFEVLRKMYETMLSIHFEYDSFTRMMDLFTEMSNEQTSLISVPSLIVLLKGWKKEMIRLRRNKDRVSPAIQGFESILSMDEIHTQIGGGLFAAAFETGNKSKESEQRWTADQQRSFIVAIIEHYIQISLIAEQSYSSLTDDDHACSVNPTTNALFFATLLECCGSLLKDFPFCLGLLRFLQNKEFDSVLVSSNLMLRRLQPSLDSAVIQGGSNVMIVIPDPTPWMSQSLMMCLKSGMSSNNTRSNQRRSNQGTSNRSRFDSFNRLICSDLKLNDSLMQFITDIAIRHLKTEMSSDYRSVDDSDGDKYAERSARLSETKTRALHFTLHLWFDCAQLIAEMIIADPNSDDNNNNNEELKQSTVMDREKDAMSRCIETVLKEFTDEGIHLTAEHLDTLLDWTNSLFDRDIGFNRFVVSLLKRYDDQDPSQQKTTQ